MMFIPILGQSVRSCFSMICGHLCGILLDVAELPKGIKWPVRKRLIIFLSEE